MCPGVPGRGARLRPGARLSIRHAVVWVACATSVNALAADVDPGPQGYRLRAAWSGSSVAVVEEAALGVGASSTRVAARWASSGGVAVELALPVAFYRTPGGRAGGLGNASLAGSLALPDAGRLAGTVGIALQAPTGSPAWTWVERAVELWPAPGGELWWQGALQTDGLLTWMFGASVGLAWPDEAPPFPARVARLAGTAGVDAALGDRVGLVVESTVAWWDVSPWELAALVRGDALGARGRVGVVLPLAADLGLTPAEGAQRPLVLVVNLAIAL